MSYFLTAVSVIGCIAIAYRAMRATKNEDFIFSRGINGFVSGLSSGATANSGFIVIGAVGMGYTMGYASLTYPLAWLVGDIFFWILFAPRVFKKVNAEGQCSVPEILARHNDWATIRKVAAFIIVIFLGVYLVAQLSSAAKAIEPQIEISNTAVIVLFALFVATYTAMGGFKASVWTDVAQAVGMLLVVGGVNWWCITEYGNFNVLSRKLEEVSPELVSLASSQTTTGIISMLGFAFVAFGYGLSQPQVTTRIMALAKSSDVIKAACTHIAFVQATWIGMCIIGMYLRIHSPGLGDPETALSSVALEFGPVWGTLVLVGMFSAIISSADSLLLASSTALSWDLLPIAPNSQSNKSTHRVCVFFIAGIAAYIATVAPGSVFTLSVLASAGLAASIGTAMAVALLRLQTSQICACLSMLAGLAAAVAWRLLTENYLSLDAAVGCTISMFVILAGRLLAKDS
ncbi:MAG: hypothetical protein AAGD11_17395 [Planctomycetota bacterium]